MTDRVRGNGVRLSPWAQLRYFQPVKMTSFPTLGGKVQVANSDPLRIMIAFTGFGGQRIMVLPSQDVRSDFGISLTDNNPNFSLNHSDHGNVVQNEWWAVASQPGGSLTVIEVALSSWPGE